MILTFCHPDLETSVPAQTALHPTALQLSSRCMKSQTNSKPKILIVDDEADNLDLLYRALDHDYKVVRAVSGPAALDLLASEGDVAALICDRHMPLISGTEFFSLTATQYPDIMQIILTDYTDVEDLVEAIDTGKVFKYVTKPWEADELRSVVRQALDTHNFLKLRTQELCQTLRQQSLLNTVTNTIRSALDYRQILQTIVQTVGQTLEASCCILRPFQDNQIVDESFVYPTAHASPLLVQTVWETRLVHAIDDVAIDERIQGGTLDRQKLASAYQAANICSSLVVPLICQQELMAVLALHQCGQPRQWMDDEVQLVVMVADQAALALSQARAYDRISALAKREALINTITRAIRSSLDPQDIFAAITEQLGQALDVDGCALSLWTEEDEFVQCVGLYDRAEESALRTPHLPQSRSPIAGNPVLQQLLKTQQPVVIDDLSQQPQMKGLDLPLRSPAKALVVVPLLIDGKSIGSITLRQTHQPRRWQVAEVELAQAVAAQAAIAVQQSRLYQKTRSLAERLQELDRQKTQFFQNISHEFRTPLTLMLGPLESAVAQQQDLPLEQAEMALRNSRRLLRLVNQLLDLQRLDVGRMQPSFRPYDLVEFVSQIVSSFRPYCEKKGICLVTELNHCPPLYLDTEKFDKVLYNLLSNAMKFTPTGGSITVTLEPAGDHCLLQVQDTGIGIRKEQIPHIFKRFHQAEGEAFRSYEGSGLGLALAKELVELHKGTISVESVYGEGSTFRVWLQTGTAHLPLDKVLEVPTQIELRSAAVELADLELLNPEESGSLEQGSKEAGGEGQGDKGTRETRGPLEVGIREGSRVGGAMQVQGEDTLPPDTHDLRSHCVAGVPQVGKAYGQLSQGGGIAAPSILVVDDNPDLRTYVSGILRSSGYQVQTARNGAEGFRVAQTQSPDLIVTDLMMPQMSGMEMIWLIRNEDKLKGTPIVLLTAKTDEETRIEGTEGGADAYLAKPFSNRELLAEVRNLLALKENERRVVELNTYLTESVLKRFLPPTMVKKAARRELVLDLRPEPHLITILFSDIVGFTPLANTLRSRRVAELLNEYLETMTRAVFDNGGTVDKFMGDAILAIFGAPEELSSNEQVRRAIATARAMHHSLSLLNQRWLAQGLVGTNHSAPVQFRCGIHQGTAVVGMFGSAERADYTAIGPSVNIAARLQQAAAPGQILVSATVADYLEEHEITKCSPLELKGVDETVLTFSVKP